MNTHILQIEKENKQFRKVRFAISFHCEFLSPYVCFKLDLRSHQRQRRMEKSTFAHILQQTNLAKYSISICLFFFIRQRLGKRQSRFADNTASPQPQKRQQNAKRCGKVNVVGGDKKINARRPFCKHMQFLSRVPHFASISRSSLAQKNYRIDFFCFGDTRPENGKFRPLLINRLSFYDGFRWEGERR